MHGETLMTQLVKFDRSNSITRYNQGNGDRLTANADESLLGHCVEERGWGLEQAIQNIKPLSKYEAIHTTRAARIGKVTAVAGFVVGLVGGGTVGAVGMLPLLGAGLAAYVWRTTEACIPRRDLEYSLLKICPQIPEIMMAVHQKGASSEVIVSAWDLLLDSYAESEGANAEQVVMEFARLLDHVGKVPELDAIAQTPTTTTRQALGAIPTPALPVAGKTCGQCQNFAKNGDGFRLDIGNESQFDGGCKAFMQPAHSQDPGESCPNFAAKNAAIAPPETYPMQASEVSPDDRRALIARLREECPALLKLVKSHPIRAVGVQRSGKTTLVKRLALLRMILMPGHRVVACTPHYKPNEGYPAVFKIAGITPDRKRDYPAIAREWQSMADGVESCQEQNKTYVFDEFGLFDKAVDEESIKSVLTSALRETMKFGIYPVFILHGETAAFMPGSKGLVTVILNSTVRVETIGEPVPDEIGLESIKPTGRFTVTWLDGSRDEGTIPTWLTEDYLLGLIGTSAPIPAPASAIAYPPPDYKNTQEQPKKTAAKATPETASDAPKLDIEKPDMPMKEIMLQCSMLAEWIEEKPGLSFAQKYANYNASRKGFTRPQFRYLLSQLGEIDL
jgi:hypothetical protein